MAEPWFQRAVLAGGIAATALAVVRIGLWPVTIPLPQPMDVDQLVRLRGQGWRVDATIPAAGRERVSNAEGVALVNSLSPELADVQLRLIPIRVRGFEDLNAESIEAAITGQAARQPSTLTLNGDQLLRFRGLGGKEFAASCIVGGTAQSRAFAFYRVFVRSPISWRERLGVIAGLRAQPAYHCLSMRIAVGPGRKANQRLSQVWARLRPLLIQAG